MDAIICMAGSARRLNVGENKVFLKIAGKPIFLYSIDALASFVDKIILSIRPEDEDKVRPYIKTDKIEFVYGGSERYISVYNAILKCNSNKVLIHDGARPLVKKDLILKIIENANDYDLVLPYLPIKGTIYQVEPFKLLDRSNVIMAQTPQLVKKDYFINSYKKAIKDNFQPTDDISLILKYYPNLKIKSVLDYESNIKITTSSDLEIVRKLL